MGLFKSLNTIQREEKLLKLPTPVSSQSYAIKHNIRHFKVQKRKVLELCPRVMKLHEGLPATSDVKMAEEIVMFSFAEFCQVLAKVLSPEEIKKLAEETVFLRFYPRHKTDWNGRRRELRTCQRREHSPHP